MTLLLLSTACGFAQQQRLDEEEILARIGPKTISVRDFVERMELMPWTGKEHPATQDSARIKAFLSLVAEKLLALQAADQGFVVNPRNSDALLALERVLARDQMFKQEIRSAVTVRGEEIEVGLRRFASTLKLGVFSMTDENSARQLATALTAQRDSVKPPIPVDGIREIDSMTITFGDVPATYEDTIYSLRPFQAKAAYDHAAGWMVFHLLGAAANPAFAELTMQERITAIRRRIEKRKEREQTGAFVRSRFTEPVRLDSSLFHLVADSLHALLQRDATTKDSEGFRSVSSDLIDKLKKMLHEKLDAPIVFSNNDRITLAQLLDELRFHPLRFTSLEKETMIEKFNASLKPVAQGALLAGEAMRRGYHHHPEVRRDLQVWVDALEAQKLLKHVLDSLARHPPGEGSTMIDRYKNVNRYVGELGTKFKAEVYLEKLRRVRLGASNLVARRFFGFGGSMTAVPMLMRLWDWFELMQKGTRVAP